MWRILFLFPLILFASQWAEETLAKMTLEEKVGQLFVAPACPLRGEDHWADWEMLLTKFHIGNAIMKRADSASQVRFLNRLQKSSKIPLLVAADDEWGLGMRTSDAIAFPKNGILGTLANRELLVSFGREVGLQARRVGVHLNLAPVADVNNNPKNPIINIRSFGDNPETVSECVNRVVEGMQSAGTLACVKHFPGHGDTEVDSHWALPLIPHSLERLEAVEFVPFRRAIEKGVDVVMLGHLLVPAIDPEMPATFSSACIRSLLKEKMGFSGLVLTDALNMRALSRYTPAESALLARKAGCDLLLYGDHITPIVDDLLRNWIPEAHRALVKAYKEGELDVKELNASVQKILEAKEKLGLHRERTVPEEGVKEFLWRPEAVALQEKLLLKN